MKHTRYTSVEVRIFEARLVEARGRITCDYHMLDRTAHEEDDVNTSNACGLGRKHRTRARVSSKTNECKQLGEKAQLNEDRFTRCYARYSTRGNRALPSCVDYQKIISGSGNQGIPGQTVIWPSL